MLILSVAWQQTPWDGISTSKPVQSQYLARTAQLAPNTNLKYTVSTQAQTSKEMAWSVETMCIINGLKTLGRPKGDNIAHLMMTFPEPNATLRSLHRKLGPKEVTCEMPAAQCKHIWKRRKVQSALLGVLYFLGWRLAMKLACPTQPIVPDQNCVNTLESLESKVELGAKNQSATSISQGVGHRTALQRLEHAFWPLQIQLCNWEAQRKNQKYMTANDSKNGERKRRRTQTESCSENLKQVPCQVKHFEKGGLIPAFAPRWPISIFGADGCRLGWKHYLNTPSRPVTQRVWGKMRSWQASLEPKGKQ